MKPKQLANVLIKILGLSLCAHSVIPILNGLSVPSISIEAVFDIFRKGQVRGRR